MKETKSKSIVSFDIPSFISDFKENKKLTTNQYVTEAKLKMFHIGITEDGRRFTEDFAKTLLESLAFTPVVAFYDKETDDFVGHNKEQHIYGIVPNSDVELEVDESDGNIWATTTVLLFTGRSDDIGTIASKIIGKQHSLELDPSTIEYKMIVEKGYLKEIEFTKGSLIGLSVVGDDQVPAFKGSSFFTSEECVNELNNIKNFLKEEKTMKTETNKETPISFLDVMNFISKSYEQLAVESIRKFREMYKGVEGYFYDAGEDFVVLQAYSACDIYGAYLKYDLNEVKEPVEVIKAYIPKEEFAEKPAPGERRQAGIIEESFEQGLVEVEVEDADDKDDKDDSIDDRIDNEDDNKDDNIDDRDDRVEEDVKDLVDKDEDDDKKARCTNEDLQELFAYRQKAKEDLIETFKEFLSETDKETFLKDINSYTVKELHTELSVKSMDYVLAAKQKETKPVANIFTNSLVKEEKQGVEATVNKYINK